MGMQPDFEWDDATLIAGALVGDDESFAAIYDRYADRLHHHVVGMVGAGAGEVLEETFHLAGSRLDQLEQPLELREWLFAIASGEARRSLLVHHNLSTTHGPPPARWPHAEMGDDPDGDADYDDLGGPDTVTAAAAQLNAPEWEILNLHDREGLRGEWLAIAAGCTIADIDERVHAARAHLERILGQLLLARLDRDGCVRLAAMLEPMDGQFTPEWRIRLARHVDLCARCGPRRHLLLASEAFAAVPLRQAPPELRQLVLERPAVAEPAELPVAAVVPPPSEPVVRPQYHWDTASAAAQPRRRGRWSLPAAAASLVVVAAAMSVWVWGWNPLPTRAADGTNTTPPATSAPATTAPGTSQGEPAPRPGSDPAGDGGAVNGEDRDDRWLVGTDAGATPEDPPAEPPTTDPAPSTVEPSTTVEPTTTTGPTTTVDPTTTTDQTTTTVDETTTTDPPTTDSTTTTDPTSTTSAPTTTEPNDAASPWETLPLPIEELAAELLPW